MNIDNDELLRFADMPDGLSAEQMEGFRIAAIAANEKYAAQRQALRDEVMDLLIEIPVTEINPESDEDLTIQMGENAQNRLLNELRTAISTIFEGKK